MNWLFVHRFFPSQFVHIARHLAARGDTVVFITHHDGQIAGIREFPGIRRIFYRTTKPRSRTHKYLVRLSEGVHNGEAVATIAEGLKKHGFEPNLIIGHSGWGEILYLKDVWPKAPLLGYFEFYWPASGAGFSDDLAHGRPLPARVRTTNAIDLISLAATDRGFTATGFQRSTYPKRYQSHISVAHEGVDTDINRPDSDAQVWLSNGVSLTCKDPLVTYSARCLEPARGFHIFMRALPLIQKRNPRVRALIVGHDDATYSPPPSGYKTYREKFVAEAGDRLDLSRVHFVGPLPYPRYRAVLQISSVHVYFTYPFVLSWSCIEAMACGCLIVGSRTEPVEEVISDGRNGLLTDFDDPEGLADRVCYALRHRQRLKAIREAARQTALKRFDMQTVCLPAQLRLLHRLAR